MCRAQGPQEERVGLLEPLWTRWRKRGEQRLGPHHFLLKLPWVLAAHHTGAADCLPQRGLPTAPSFRALTPNLEPRVASFHTCNFVDLRKKKHFLCVCDLTGPQHTEVPLKSSPASLHKPRKRTLNHCPRTPVFCCASWREMSPPPLSHPDSITSRTPVLSLGRSVHNESPVLRTSQQLRSSQ